MAGSLNKVLLIGRLGADPEIKQMVNGKSVARLSLATSQSWKDKNTGEKKEKTEWHRIVVFNEGLVNVVQQYLKKGAQIYVEGQITTNLSLGISTEIFFKLCSLAPLITIFFIIIFVALN